MDKNIKFKSVQFYTIFNEHELSFQNNSNNSTFAQHVFDNGYNTGQQILPLTKKRSNMYSYQKYNIYEKKTTGNQINDKNTNIDRTGKYQAP